MLLFGLSYLAFLAAAESSSPSCKATTLHLSDPPYENYFYSDCHVDAQAVVTSPLPDSDWSIIGPRVIVAWPSGNSGVCAYFQPQSGQNGSLGIELVNSTLGSPLSSVTGGETAENTVPTVGVEGILSLNSSATLSLAILGSVRTIRDYAEGGGILSSVIQDAIEVQSIDDNSVRVSRLWLDNVTTTAITISPWENSNGKVRVDNKTAHFDAGLYRFAATMNYPQLKQLTPDEILDEDFQHLEETNTEEVEALSFFSYSDKLLAGGWRFLTYFGRDSMISALLLQPILKTGKGSAMEAVIGAALERIRKDDGTVAHEETIGDYATFQNMQNKLNSTAASFNYLMVDTDFYLPVLMDRYFQAAPDRLRPLLETAAGEVNVDNKNMTWGDLAYRLASKIMNITEAFENEQKPENLIHLLDGDPTGQWRDSAYGLAGGRIPFDVNCALVPAALRAVANLATMPGVFPQDSTTSDWATKAAARADVWQKQTLPFFRYSDSARNASALLDNYVTENTFYHGPNHSDTLTQYSAPESTIVDYGLALKSVDKPSAIRVTHTDTAFRNVLLFNTTDDDAQLTEFINSTANAILRPFPAGLTTPIGAVVANPALSGDADIISGFTNSAYHGTVIWGWQLALVAKGFELQLGRCPKPSCKSKRVVAKKPAFCQDASVYGALKAAYNRIWDVIEANESVLQSEVWSWTFSNETEGSGFKYSPLGVLPPPPGSGSATESDVRQLWSLVFLAMNRDGRYE